MSRLIPINPQEHFLLFKLLYGESFEWMTHSFHPSVVDYESALLNPTCVWRIYEYEGTPVGLAGLQSINWIDGSADPLVAITPASRRNGIGLEMGWELAALGFRELGLRRLHTMVLEDAPSKIILEKMGFIHEATMEQVKLKDGKYRNVLAYRMFREEYEKCQ